MLLIVLLGITEYFAFGQEVYSASAVNSSLSVADLVEKMDADLNKVIDFNSNIEGSPYVYETFLPALVYSKANNFCFTVKANKNAFTNLFEFKYEDAIYEMPNFVFDSVIISNSSYIPVSIKNDHMVSIFSMLVIASDYSDNYLLKKEIVKFMDRVAEKPFIEETPPRYKRFPPEYYIYEGGSNLVKIDKVKALSSEAFSPRDLNEFIKKNKIRKKNENDLVRLFDHIFSSKAE